MQVIAIFAVLLIIAYLFRPKQTVDENALKQKLVDIVLSAPKPLMGCEIGDLLDIPDLMAHRLASELVQEGRIGMTVEGRESESRRARLVRYHPCIGVSVKSK